MAPGKSEIEQEKPFIGMEGQHLRSKCRRVGIELDDCYVTNVAHQRPPRDEFSLLPRKAKEFGTQELFKDISYWKPNVILCLGADAFFAITGKSGIMKYRGAVMESPLIPGQKVIGMVHPGNIFKGNQRFDIVLKSDLEKAVRESAYPDIIYPERNVKVLRKPHEAIAFLKSITNIPDIVSVDIETAGKVLVAYGVATSKSQSCVLTRHMCADPKVLRAIGEFTKSSTPKMFHNALYDVFHNAYFYKILNNNVAFDTMIAGHSVFPTLPKSLAFYASFFTNEVYWKEEGKEIIQDLQKSKIVDWEAFYVYNGKDCCLTYEIYEYLKEEIEYWQVEGTFQMMMDMLGPALFSQICGLYQNNEKVKVFAEKNEKAIEILEKVKDSCIGQINVKSSQKLCDLVYNQWDMPKQYKVYKGKKTLTTEAEKLQELERYPTPFKPHIGLILYMKKKYKMRDFYNIKCDEDSRVRFSHNICGTYTGRWSTSKSILGTGFNAQTQPHEIRTFYESDPGKIFLEPDLSNAEARIVAALTGDEDWLRSFDEKDQHSVVAMALFGIPYENVRDLNPGTGKTYRDAAKKITHATHYLYGWPRLARTLACSPKEAKLHKENYFYLRPKLAEWHNRVNTEVRMSRVIRTCFGRVIQFFGPNFDKMLTDAVAAEPQSTSVDYLNYAIVDYYKQIKEFEFCQHGHDSVLCQVPDDFQCIENTILKMKKITERPITVNGLELTIPLDFKIGYCWGELKEIKDLNGLKNVYENLQ